VKLNIIAVGHKPPTWVVSAFNEYGRRMPRELPLLLHEIRPAERSGNNAALTARARATESSRIVAAIPPGSVKVALDEHGKMMTTRQLADRIGQWMHGGRDVAFLIGGADGLDQQIRNDADLVFSLSRLTMPHALARIVLAEQLYRAMSIIRNHPYHRE
jgi:23S rRNA (pseudouridine1915-N3)-methyltransferase